MIQSSPGPTRFRYPLLTLLATTVIGGAALLGMTVWSPFAMGQGTPAPEQSGPIAVPAGLSPPTRPTPRATPKPQPQTKARGLDPLLREALDDATDDAADDGVRIVVNSGWRSAAEQQRLLDEAVVQYGSEQEALRWVATPEKSEHVSGDAVDLGPTKATPWLAEHGAAYGLCPIYRNEPWHYELRPQAAEQGCPALYANPTADPRMH